MQTVKFWWDKFLFQLGSGAPAMVLRDGITRAPCIQMESAEKAAELKLWCEQIHNFDLPKQAFESTDGFGKLINVQPAVAGKNVFFMSSMF